MKIHEYQAKEVFARYGIPVPKGRVATTPDAAAEIAADIGGSVVVKAQVHAGGRGKAGGIKVVDSPQAAAEAAKAMLGTTLVTFQTGPEGVPISSVLVEEAISVESEMYVGMAVDGAAEGIVAIASAAGGVEIEEVAETTPEKILTVAIDPVLGLQPFQGRKLAYGLGVADSLNRPVASLMASLYKLFEENDCSLVEINPLGVTTDGRVLAMDAKINIDDDAMFRRRDIAGLRDVEQEDHLEVEAGKFDINYVKLDGDVGCIVNGAGTRDGHDGCHSRRWSVARQLPRHRWWRRRGEVRQVARDRAVGRQRKASTREHLRRHSQVRRCRTGIRHGL